MSTLGPSASASHGILPLTSHIPNGIAMEAKYNYAWAGFALLVGLIVYTSTRPKHSFVAIPAVGRTGFISSYISAIRTFQKPDVVLREGYDKHKSGIFCVPELGRWHIIVCGEKLIEEYRKAPDDVLSLDEASREAIATDYTMGLNAMSDTYHMDVIRSQLTRNLAILFPKMRDELVSSFEDYVPETDDWTPVKPLQVVMKIVSRTTNRILVGLPTCRDSEYINLNIQFTVDVSFGANLINLFPYILRPIAGRLFANPSKAIKIGLKHLGPVIEERQQKIDEYGFDNPDKPNDFLSWLMDEAQGEQRSKENLTLRVLGTNFAAIHTTSISFTHALLHLAARPEYIQPIREEVEKIVAQDGWTKVSMTRMHKLDSFLKESQRYDGIGGVTMSRKVMKDFTFSDGTRLPEGAFVSIMALGIHFNEDIYADAHIFNGFRFSDIREEDGEGTKHQMVATSSEYLPFGLGKHACPGRFFAANELKAMMAHLILTYDIKMENEGVLPANRWFSFACVPDPEAKVLFRKRRTPI